MKRFVLKFKSTISDTLLFLSFVFAWQLISACFPACFPTQAFSHSLDFFLHTAFSLSSTHFCKLSCFTWSQSTLGETKNCIWPVMIKFQQLPAKVKEGHTVKLQIFVRCPFSYFSVETGSYELIFVLSRASKQMTLKLE